MVLAVMNRVKFFKIFLMSLLALIISSAIVFIIFEEDGGFKRLAEQRIDAFFSETFECQFHAHLNHINLITGEVELTDLAAVSSDTERWSWQAPHARVSFSWFDLLLHHSFFLDIEITGFHAYSESNNGDLALYNHILSYLKAPPVKPFLLGSFTIRDGSCQFVDKNNNHALAIAVRVDTKLVGRQLKTTVIFHDGTVTLAGKKFIEHLKGTIGQPINSDTLDGRITAELVPFPAEQQYITLLVSYKNNTGTAELYTLDRACHTTFSLDQHSRITLSCQFPVSCIQGLLMPELQGSADGTCLLTGLIDVKKEIAGSGNFSSTGLKIATVELPEINASWALKNSILSTDWALTKAVPDFMRGQFSWDFNNQTGDCSSVANKEIVLPLGTIKPDTLQLSAKMRADPLQSTGQFSGTIIDTEKQEKKVTGDFALALGNCSVNAQYDQKKLQCVVEKLTNITCSYHDGDKELCSLRSTTSKRSTKFSAFLEYQWLQTVLSLKDSAMAGDGTFELAGTLHADGVDAHLAMRNAHIKLPNTYNLMKELSADISIDKKLHGTIKNFKAQLNKGDIVSKEIIVHADYTDTGFLVRYAHCPFILDNCFVGLHNDMFTLVTGAGLIEYKHHEKTALKGQLLLNQTHVSNNIFSSEFMQNFSGTGVNPVSSYTTDTELAISVQTQSPIHVKTPFLDVSAHLSMAVDGTLAQPLVTGAIELVNGNLEFPYQPLFITRGKINFTPHQPDDPLLDVVARNSIKKYAVTMAIDGSVRDPKISFSSSPHLDEAAIISLLLGGADDGSLSLVMPQAVMGSVRDLIFGSTTTSSTLLNSLQRIVKPFKNIRLVPGFSDNTGRGGVRGSLMIEVDDRLRGMIQQNFSLPEDVKIEVEYALSDDTTIRALRDERGDTGAELEMRWKF